MEKITSLSDVDFHSATGKLPYTLTNDFLFKSLLQKNKKVLKALVASLMHLEMEDITSIGYLARSFDNLEKGDDYADTKSVVHIGFLNFDLPDIPPEFYGTYKLLNVKNYAKYSDKFTLSVVNLKHIDLATTEDKKYGIDKWAALFKATTWEEIKMIAGKDEHLNEASSELFKRLADLAVWEECEARERYYREKARLEQLEKETVEKDKVIARREQTIAKKTKDLAKRDKTIDELNSEVQRLQELLIRNHISPELHKN